MNLRGLLRNVRTRLGSPKSQRPSDKELLLLLSTHVQSFINRANLSAKPWAVDEIPLQVTAGVEDYPVGSASQFGKPIQVRTVFPQNPAHIERDIDFFELGDINFDWNYPKNLGNLYYNADGSPHTALRMGFFRKSGIDQVYMRVMPIPQSAATYQVLYQIGLYGETAELDDTPIVPQHHGLIEVRTAIDALPLTEWDDSEDSNRKKREELALSLPNTEKTLNAEFLLYMQTATVSRRPSYRNMYEID